MFLQKTGADNNMASHKFTPWPKIAFIDKDTAVRFSDQSRSPRLRHPSAVDLFLHEKGEDIRIRNRNDCHVSAPFLKSKALCLEVGTERYILSVANLRR